MCNIGIACLEELSDFDDVIGSDKPKKTSQKKAARQSQIPKGPKAKADAKKKAPAKA